MLLIFLSLLGLGACQTHCPLLSHCSLHGPAVCGSDGKTYKNTCALSVAICHAKLAGRHLSLAHSGACRTTPVTSSNAHCDMICNEESGTAEQVCLSDGQTYESKCDAMNAICNASHNHLHLTVIHTGECLTLHSSCQNAFQQPCDTSRHYMCASNGYTYQNECYLKQAMCRLASNPSAEPIEILHEGLCHDNSTNSSRNVDCSKYADMSLQSLAVEGQTVQINRCASYSAIVSGSNSHAVCADGISYYSECYFCYRMAQMHKISYTQLNMPISHDGACQHTVVIG